MSSYGRAVVLISTFAIALAWIPGARAAEPAEEAGVGKKVENITITARKREETLQQTPVSVAAMTSADLDSRTVTNYFDVAHFVPNLTMVPSTGGTPGMSATIRGAMSPDAILTDDVAVGIYIDGVYMGKNSGQMLEMLDIERIEVLRGPQGTLYGKNTLGGAVNYVTRRPSGDWGGRAVLRNGNRNLFNGTVTLDVPMIGENGLRLPERLGELASKVTFDYVNREPFFPNVLPGGPDGFRDLQRYSGHLAVRSTNFLLQGLIIDYSFDLQFFDESGPGSQLTLVKATSDNGFGQQNPTLLGLGNCALRNWTADFSCFGDAANYVFGRPEQIQPERSSRLTNQAPAFAHFEGMGHAVTVTYDLPELGPLGNVTLKSITGYRRMDLGDGFDFDSTGVTWVQRKVSQDDYKAFQQEFDAIGRTGVPGGELDYVIGFFYSSEEGLDRQDFVLIPALVPYCTANPGFCGALAAAPNLSTTNFSYIDNYSLAPYGQATYSIGLPMGELDLTAGVRYTYEKKKVTRAINSIAVAPLPATVLTPPTPFSATFDDVSPMGTVAWQATPEHMIYATVAKGFKSGGFNGRATTSAGFLPYESEKLISYELGLKSRFFDDRLQLNTAGFFNDNYDRQVQVFALAPTGGVTTITRNAAKVHIWGAEVELVARPFEGAELIFGYGLTLPEYREFIDTNPVTGLPQDVSNLRAFFRTPEHDLIIGGAYTLPAFSWGVVTGRLDWHWQSEVFFSRTNFQTTPQGSYGLLQARLEAGQIDVAGTGQLSVGLWGRNLLDEKYRENGSDWGGLGFAQNQYGIPRSYGIDVKLEF